MKRWMNWTRPTKHLREPSRRRGSPRRRRGARRRDCWRRPSRPRSVSEPLRPIRLFTAPAGSWAPRGRIAWQRCCPPAGALALATVNAKAYHSTRRASTARVHAGPLGRRCVETRPQRERGLSFQRPGPKRGRGRRRGLLRARGKLRAKRHVRARAWGAGAQSRGKSESPR